MFRKLYRLFFNNFFHTIKKNGLKSQNFLQMTYNKLESRWGYFLHRKRVCRNWQIKW